VSSASAHVTANNHNAVI